MKNVSPVYATTGEHPIRWDEEHIVSAIADVLRTVSFGSTKETRDAIIEDAVANGIAREDIVRRVEAAQYLNRKRAEAGF